MLSIHIYVFYVVRYISYTFFLFLKLTLAARKQLKIVLKTVSMFT